MENKNEFAELFSKTKRESQEEKDDLLPCPFCGGEAKLKTFHFHETLTCYQVKCERCETESVLKSDLDFVVASWNVRTSPLNASQASSSGGQEAG